MLRLWVFIVVVCLCAPAWSADVEGLRVWVGPDKTRAVLDLTDKAEYRLFQLKNPDRVVVDLQRSGLKQGFRSPEIDSAIIAGVRSGKRGDKDLRVVFDLNDQAHPKSFMLQPAGQYGHRLVVDFYPQQADTPAEPIKRITQVIDDNRDVIVAIDAGHGGEDPGAIGPTGLREKDVVLKIAKEVKKLIDAQKGMRAILVREGDYYILHEGRPLIARQKRADLFVSIHADAFKDRRVRGSSVFVLNQRRAASEASQWLADRENRSDLVGGVSLDDKDDTLAAVLLDLSQSASMEASEAAAEQVFRALKRVGKTHGNQIKGAPFAVLISPDIPSILVETGFISNPEEEKRLRSKQGRQKISNAIAAGISSYFRANPPPRSWLANNPAPASHVVSRGETLSEIAVRHSISLARLREANDIKGDMLKVGDVLEIPAG